MIRLLLRPPHFECDTPSEAAKLARIIRISSERPMIEVADAASAKQKRCECCKALFSTVDHGDRASRRCRKCRAPKPTWKPRAARKAKVAPAPSPAPVVKRRPAPVEKHGPKCCTTCGATVPEFEMQDGECYQCAPMARRRAS